MFIHLKGDEEQHGYLRELEEGLRSEPEVVVGVRHDDRVILREVDDGWTAFHILPLDATGMERFYCHTLTTLAETLQAYEYKLFATDSPEDFGDLLFNFEELDGAILSPEEYIRQKFI